MNDGLTILSAPWLPPWANQDTPAEVVERPLVPFCGVEEGREVNQAVRQCFVDVATAGRAVEFAAVTPTVEGDPIAIIYGFDPVAGFSILYDSSQDSFGSGTWTVQNCQFIVPDPDAVFAVEGCDDGGELR